jgi:hypothetical protein
MIRVSGDARFMVYFNVEIDMTEEEWEGLSYGYQEAIIDQHIGYEEMKNAEMTDCDVDDVIEVDDENRNF